MNFYWKFGSIFNNFSTEGENIMKTNLVHPYLLLRAFQQYQERGKRFFNNTKSIAKKKKALWFGRSWNDKQNKQTIPSFIDRLH
jgi:hypothetical protein